VCARICCTLWAWHVLYVGSQTLTEQAGPNRRVWDVVGGEKSGDGEGIQEAIYTSMYRPGLGSGTVKVGVGT
jgi:hypothetical protein